MSTEATQPKIVKLEMTAGLLYISMGESNIVVSAYTMDKHYNSIALTHRCIQQEIHCPIANVSCQKQKLKLLFAFTCSRDKPCHVSLWSRYSSAYVERYLVDLDLGFCHYPTCVHTILKSNTSRNLYHFEKSICYFFIMLGRLNLDNITITESSSGNFYELPPLIM